MSGHRVDAEFAQEWDTIYSVLKNDIELDELPVVYLIPRRMFLDKNSMGGNDGKKTFKLGGGGGSENPLGAVTKPLNLNMSPQLAFEMFDGDESGSVSFNEFRQVFNKLNTDVEQQIEFKAELRELFYNTNTSNIRTRFSKSSRQLNACTNHADACYR